MKLATAIGITLLVAISGCTSANTDPAQMGVIEWSTGGSFAGARGGRLYADNSVVGWSFPPFGKMTETRSQARPGTFDKALGWLRANPLPTSDIDRGPPCADYGSDIVRYSGPGRSIDYSAGCPNNKVLEYQFRLLEVIGGGN